MPGRTLTEQEYQAVRDQVMKSAPPNMDEATFTRWVGPQMHAALVEAELKPPMLEDPAAWRFVKSAASVLNPIAMVEGAYNAVRHPIDTATGIVNQQLDQGKQAIDLAKEGRYSEAAGHGLAAAVPLVGPAAAAAGEQFASGDVAGGAGTAAALTLPFLAKPGMALARKVVPKSARVAAARALEEGAAGRYEKVMAPQVGPNKTRFGNMATDVAPKLAADPSMSALSRAGLHGKVVEAFDATKAQLDAAADARNKGAAFDTQPLLESLQKARDALVAEPVDATTLTPESGFSRAGDGTLTPTKTGTPIGKTVEPAPNAARLASIDQVIKEVQQLGSIARYESLRRIRQAWDAVAKTVYSPAVTADYLKAKGGALGAADATAAIREQLAKMDPSTAAVNEKYSLYKTANDVLDATAEVERTRPKVGRAIMARLTGSLVGGETAGAMGAVAGFALGPTMEAILSAGGTTKLVTAQLMQKLAAAIRSGDVQAVDSLLGKLKRAAVKLTPASAAAAGNLAPAMATGSPASTPGPRAAQ